MLLLGSPLGWSLPGNGSGGSGLAGQGSLEARLGVEVETCGFEGETAPLPPGASPR